MFSKRLSPFTTNHLSQEVGSHKGYTLVGIPGQFYHQQIENTFKKVRIILNIKYRIYPRIGRTFFPEKWDRNWGCGLYAGTRTRPQQFFFPMKTIESLGCGQYAGAAYLRVNTVFNNYLSMILSSWKMEFS